MKTLFAAFALAAAAVSPPASAVTTVYTATLTGAAESPPNASTGSGNATLTYDSVLHSLLVDLSFSGLTTATSAGHIHCCVAPGGNVDVAVPFAGLPSATSGTYSRTFALDASSSYTAAFLALGGGTVAGAEALLVGGLQAGRAYVNLHNAVYPAGEVRGFVVSSVPEPSTLALAAAGLAVVGVAAHRRRAVGR